MGWVKYLNRIMLEKGLVRMQSMARRSREAFLFTSYIDLNGEHASISQHTGNIVLNVFNVSRGKRTQALSFHVKILPRGFYVPWNLSTAFCQVKRSAQLCIHGIFPLFSRIWVPFLLVAVEVFWLRFNDAGNISSSTWTFGMASRAEVC